MNVGDVLSDRYEIEQLLGVGGMSGVYLALDRMLERRVALKVLHQQYSDDPEYVARFRREAQAIARLSHPNIVTVIDRGEFDGRQYIVFEYVAGANLKELVEQEGPLPVAQALAVTHQVARGLAFAHEHGIVHRDVKPQNVLIDAERRAKVTDFGIARSLDHDEALTMAGTVVGTSDYIAPEQARGETVDERSDQYSLGALLYELLCGRPPYSGDSFMAVAMRHLRDPVPSIRTARPDVSPRVDSVVRRAMAKSRDERFPTTEAMIGALEACMVEEAGAGAEPAEDGRTAALPIVRTGPRPAPARSVVGRRPRRPGALRGTLVIVLGLGLLAVVLALALRGAGGGGAGGTDGGNGSGASGATVHLRALHDFDPYGDGAEHPEDVPKATDGDAGTFWTTESYRSFGKPGVGLVLDAGQPVALSTVTVVSDEPGFRARIRAGSSPGGPFGSVTAVKTVADRTTFSVDTAGKTYRYYVIWIVDPNGRAHVNEVRARAPSS